MALKLLVGCPAAAAGPPKHDLHWDNHHPTTPTHFRDTYQPHLDLLGLHIAVLERVIINDSPRPVEGLLLTNTAAGSSCSCRLICFSSRHWHPFIARPQVAQVLLKPCVLIDLCSNGTGTIAEAVMLIM